MSFWDYLTNSQSLGWLKTTLWLAALPIGIGLALALPLGWLASLSRWAYLSSFWVFGILYTIPSLVLFLLLPGLIGTGILAPTNVVIALSVYTLALLVRTVADGLSSVSTDTLNAAEAMGYTGWQRLLKVQLPLAVPVIGAGVRVATVANVSLVSVASVIGVSQLGSLFTEAFNNNTTTPALAGLIWFILIALVYDGVVLAAIFFLTPWRRAVAAR